MAATLIADSGATKCEWCLLNNNERTTVVTTGINPYFLSKQQIVELLQKELLPSLSFILPQNVFFYGTGLGNESNKKTIEAVLKDIFGAKTNVETDMVAAARAACGATKGMVCILGTGSNTCYYNGKKNNEKHSWHRVCFGR